MSSVLVYVYELAYYNNNGLLTTIDFNTIQEAESYNLEKKINGETLS